jgi:putative PIN family toxin of toxin-antitoxin system
MRRVIIDTNVLYAGLYSSVGASHQVLRDIECGKIRFVLSATLVFEYEDVLRRNPSLLGLSNEEIDDILNDLCSRGEHQTIYFLWRPKLSDPKDDHILELAVASNTSTIVTHNIRDFKNAQEFGIIAITPAQFLEEIR